MMAMVVVVLTTTQQLAVGIQASAVIVATGVGHLDILRALVVRKT
jgi:hypothetical protein